MNGLFNRTHELWRNTPTQNEIGEMIPTWGKVADVPGRADPASVSNTIAAAQPVGIIVWTFDRSPDAGVKKGDEIRFDGRRLAVKVVPVTSSGRRCECRCLEVQ